VAEKRFRIAAADIRPIAEGHGACLATDRIVVDGEPVGFMVRQPPDNDQDSGWRFMAGTESDEYMDDPSNIGVYDVNTIANYDPHIVPFLGAPVGASFLRPVPGDGLESEPEAEADVAAAAAEAAAQADSWVRRGLTSEWSMELPESFMSRVVDGTLQVLDPAPPPRTAWIDAWGLPQGVSADEVLTDVRAAARPADAAIIDEPGDDGDVRRFGSEYREVVEGREQWSLYAYTLRPTAYVSAAFISAGPDLEWAYRAWRSLRYEAPGG
jgi:hypothetical protein